MSAWPACSPPAGERCRSIGRLMLAAGVLVLSVFVATEFGLVTLIANGYRALAYLFIAVYVVPLLLRGLWTRSLLTQDAEVPADDQSLLLLLLWLTSAMPAAPNLRHRAFRRPPHGPRVRPRRGPQRQHQRRPHHARISTEPLAAKRVIDARASSLRPASSIVHQHAQDRPAAGSRPSTV
jgi:hypothetical protein